MAILGGGCSGLQYKMDLQDNPAHRDILVESGGVRVVVDPKSALYVTGSELDYLDTLDGGFKVKNPNAATTCSCGESFSARTSKNIEPRTPNAEHRMGGGRSDFGV